MDVEIFESGKKKLRIQKYLDIALTGHRILRARPDLGKGNVNC